MNNNSNNASWASQEKDNNSSDPIEYWWESASLNPKDLLDKAENWSLAADVATATILKSISKKIILNTQEVVTALSSVQENSEKLSAAVQNSNTEFNLLSNIQFIENRTYQDSDSLPEDDDRPQTKSDPTPEEILSSYKRALQTGVELVKSTIQHYEISDSDSDSESPARPLTVFKRIDSYGERKLPHIIGSEEFHNDKTLGLFFPSEKGASSVRSPTSSESEVEDEKMKASIGYNIKGISSKILEDESDSDLDIPSNAVARTSKQSNDSAHPVFIPSEAILGIASNVKNDLSQSFSGLLSDSEDEGPLIFAPDAIESGRSISTPNGPKPNASFGEVSPITNEKQRKDHKPLRVKNELIRNLVSAEDSNDEDSLFYSKTNCTMVPSSKVVLTENSNKRTKPNRKLRKKKGLFDSSSSSSTEDISNMNSSENVFPDISASSLKKPVGGINIFNSAITKAIQSQKQNESSAKEHSNFSSSENSCSTPSSVKKSIVKNVSDQAISSSVRPKSSHTTSGIEAEKVFKPVRHNSFFSDEEDLFAPVPMPKSHTSSGNPVSLFDDSDDDLFGAPSKAYNVVSTYSKVQQSNSKAICKPLFALSQSNNNNTEHTESNDNKQYYVKPKVYEDNKSTPPSMKYPTRKALKNIFGSSSSGDEDIFTPSRLPKAESQQKPSLPSALKTQGEKSVKNSSFGGEDDLFSSAPLPTPNVKQQLPELPNSNMASTSSVSNPLKDKVPLIKTLPNQAKKNVSDKLEKDTLKTSVQRDNKNVEHQRTNDNPFSSSSDDDIFNFSDSIQNRGLFDPTSKTAKDNDNGVVTPKSGKSNNSTAINIQTKSQDLSHSSDLINSSKSDHLCHSQAVSNDSSMPFENSVNDKTNLVKSKPLTIFDDDSDEDIFAVDFGSRTTYIGSNEKQIRDNQIPSDFASNDTLIGRSKDDSVDNNKKKPYISEDKLDKATAFDAVLIKPVKDTFIDVHEQKSQYLGGNSLIATLKKKSSEDLSIFEDEDSDDIFSSKSTEKIYTKKIIEGDKSHSDVNTPIAVSASGVAKEIISCYDDDDIFSSNISCHINSLIADAKSPKNDSSNQNAPASPQTDVDHLSKEQHMISNNQVNKNLIADYSTENNAQPKPLSMKKQHASQTNHNAFENDSKIVREEVISNSKQKKTPPKVSQKPVKSKTIKCQDGSNAVDGYVSKSITKPKQLPDSNSDEPKVIPIVNSNIDKTVNDLIIAKSPKKKPIGGVALFGGNELLAKIKKRQDSEDRPVPEQASTPPTSEVIISDDHKTIYDNLGKYPGIETHIQSAETRVVSFSETDPKHSGYAHQKVISLERGSSFEDPPSSSISVLKSMNKDRPRIKQQRNPPSRSRRKANIASKGIIGKNSINDLPKQVLDEKQASVSAVIADSGARSSTMSDIFGNDDDDDDDLFSTDKKKKENLKSKENILDSKQEYTANESVPTVHHISKTLGNVTVPKLYSLKQTENPSTYIDDKDSGLKFLDRIHKNEQLFDPKTKKEILKPSNLFGDDDEDDDALFSESSSTKKIKASSFVASKPTFITSKKKISLFSDDEDEDSVLDTKGNMSKQAKETISKTNIRPMVKKTSLFSDDESEDLFNSSSVDRKERKKESRPGEGTSLQKKKDFYNDPLMSGQI